MYCSTENTKLHHASIVIGTDSDTAGFQIIPHCIFTDKQVICNFSRRFVFGMGWKRQMKKLNILLEKLDKADLKESIL